MRTTQKLAAEHKAFGRSRVVPSPSIKLPSFLLALLALLMILLAAPVYAGSRYGDHGGRFHHGDLPAFYHSHGRTHFLFGGYLCGLECGLNFDSGGYDYGSGADYGYGGGDGGGAGYDNGYRNGFYSGYRNGAGNAVSGSGSIAGYVPDPVGADIPPLIIPTNCWVRRAAYDPSGAYFGQVLVNLCRTSDRVTVTGSKPQGKAPYTGTGPPANRPQNP